MRHGIPWRGEARFKTMAATGVCPTISDLLRMPMVHEADSRESSFWPASAKRNGQVFFFCLFQLDFSLKRSWSIMEANLFWSTGRSKRGRKVLPVCCEPSRWWRPGARPSRKGSLRKWFRKLAPTIPAGRWRHAAVGSTRKLLLPRTLPSTNDRLSVCKGRRKWPGPTWRVQHAVCVSSTPRPTFPNYRRKLATWQIAAKSPVPCAEVRKLLARMRRMSIV